MYILGIETSCDETACAVVRDGCEVLANVVYTQIPLHQPYGGVVPEIASRAHVEKISEVINTCLAQFREAVPGGKVDAVAVTYGPGLSPALIVGLNAAKGLALSLGVPLIGINHIEAHLHTPFLYDAERSARGADPAASSTQSATQNLSTPNPNTQTPKHPNNNSPLSSFPALGLAISGGHTNWFDIDEIGRYRTIGQTLDDAAGEAFDKAAKLLGLGYPGGPKIDKIAKEYFASVQHASLIAFPKGRPREGVTALAGLPAELCVSFSGLKTALLRYVQQHPELTVTNGGSAGTPRPTISTDPNNQTTKQPNNASLPCVVASYQEAIVQAVADRTRTALRRKAYKALIIGGGVSLNSRLRTVLGEVAEQAGVPLLMAKPKYCGDNGAMIAGLAYFRRNLVGEEAMRLDVAPSLEIA